MQDALTGGHLLPRTLLWIKPFSCKNGRARSYFWTLKPHSLQIRPDDL